VAAAVAYVLAVHGAAQAPEALVDFGGGDDGE